MYTDRQLKIIAVLKSADGWMSGSLLRENIGVSSRTLQMDIKAINEKQSGEPLIQSNNRLGYLLKNKIALEQEQKSYGQENYVHSKQIITLLLFEKEYTSIGTISERLFFSRSSVTSDLPQVKRIISRTPGANLLVSGQYGLKIQASENVKRIMCMKTMQSRQDYHMLFSEEEMEKVRQLYDQGVQNGVPGMELLGRDATLEKQPGLAENTVGSLWAPTGAITCPYEMTIACAENAHDNGVEFYFDFRAEKITTLRDAVEVEDDNNVLFRSRYVVNAAGIHADEISRMMGDDSFTIDGRKGEYILLDRSASGFVQRVVFQAPSALGKGVLVSPTVDGNAFVGPTAVDHSDKEDTSVTQQGIDALKAAGRKSMPDVPLNRPITSFAGVRAVPSTGDFILGQSAANPRLIQAAGISSPGLSSTPAIAMETVESLRKAGLQLQPRGDFNPVREHEKAFRNMTEEEREAAIAKDPRYGRIICRCESVTEAEIIHAIERTLGKPTLDGVKRRTRAGMGRCQGGFCAPRVMELIAQYGGVPMEKITKNGGASRLIVGRTRKEERKK